MKEDTTRFYAEKHEKFSKILKRTIFELYETILHDDEPGVILTVFVVLVRFLQILLFLFSNPVNFPLCLVNRILAKSFIFRHNRQISGIGQFHQIHQIRSLPSLHRRTVFDLFLEFDKLRDFCQIVKGY